MRLLSAFLWAHILFSNWLVDVGNFSYFFSHSNSHQCKLTWNAKLKGNQFSYFLFVSYFLDGVDYIIACSHAEHVVFKTAMHRMSYVDEQRRHALYIMHLVKPYAPNHNAVVRLWKRSSVVCTVHLLKYIFRVSYGDRYTHCGAHTNSSFPYVNRKWLHTFRDRWKVNVAVA